MGQTLLRGIVVFIPEMAIGFLDKMIYPVGKIEKKKKSIVFRSTYARG